MTDLSEHFKAVFFVLFGFLAFNIADAFLKHLTNIYSMGIAALYPVMFYLVFLVIFSKKMGGLKPIVQSKRKPLLILRSIFGTTCFLCFIYSIVNLTFAQTYTFVLTSAFWVALISIALFGEKVGWHRWASIFFGFIGVLIALRPGTENINTAAFVALLAGFLYACLVIATKKLGENEPLINLVFYPIVTDIIALAVIITLYEKWVLPQPEHLLFFASGGIFYLLGTAFTSKGYATGESSLLAPLHYSQILWGALLGYFFFGQIPEKWTLIGALIIIISGIYLLRKENKVQRGIRRIP